MSSPKFHAHTLIAAYSKGWVPEKCEDYKSAILCLNKLQSNVSPEGINLEMNQRDKFKDMVEYLEKSGLTFEDLDKLSVIHVTGTKGKVCFKAFNHKWWHFFYHALLLTHYYSIYFLCDF